MYYCNLISFLYFQQAVWACGHDPLEGKLYPDFGVCTGGTNALLYAWARNAKSIELPKGVGFEVGGNTGRKYLVVQVHYMNLDKDFDTSGVEVELFFINLCIVITFQ